MCAGLLASRYTKQTIATPVVLSRKTFVVDNPLEYAMENIPLTEALVAGAQKGRMIRDSFLDAELAEPFEKRLSAVLLLYRA